MVSTVELKYGVKLYWYEFHASCDILTLEVFETIFSVRRETISCGFLLKVQYFKAQSTIINSLVNKLKYVCLFQKFLVPALFTLALLWWQWRLWIRNIHKEWLRTTTKLQRWNNISQILTSFKIKMHSSEWNNSNNYPAKAEIKSAL